MINVIGQTRPVARKNHRCNCGVLIEPGDRYTRITCVNDGYVYDWLSCFPCEASYPEAEHYSDFYSGCGVGPDDFYTWAQEESVYGVGMEQQVAQAWMDRSHRS